MRVLNACAAGRRSFVSTVAEVVVCRRRSDYVKCPVVAPPFGGFQCALSPLLIRGGQGGMVVASIPWARKIPRKGPFPFRNIRPERTETNREFSKMGDRSPPIFSPSTAVKRFCFFLLFGEPSSPSPWVLFFSPNSHVRFSSKKKRQQSSENNRTTVKRH